MIPTYTATQIRAAETAALAGSDGPRLMRRAARRVADAVLADLHTPVPGRRVVLLVGAGNNGGDALFAGVDLRRRGVTVTAVLVAPDRAHRDGLAAFRRHGGRVWDADRASVADICGTADVIVDGLVGLGARPPLRPDMAEVVETANAAGAWRIAVDVPSGIDPDTGVAPGPAFAADVTVTFGGIKTGLMIADLIAGRVELAPIGMQPAAWAPEVGYDAMLLTDSDVATLVPAPGPHDDKYSRGVVGIVAGSDRYPGAALLAVGGAIRTRPGLVRYAGPGRAAIVARWPETVVSESVPESGTVQAWVVGPGMGTDGDALARLRDVLHTDVPVLVDADGITLLAGAPGLLADRIRRGVCTVLTPHAGEFARLFPDLDPSDRVRSVRAAAHRCGAVVLLKGHRTVVADPQGRLAVNTSGSAYLATAGSGDILSGIAGSLLATGLDPLTAAALAAHIHGRAGERAETRRAAGASALLDLLW